MEADAVEEPPTPVAAFGEACAIVQNVVADDAFARAQFGQAAIVGVSGWMSCDSFIAIASSVV